ncbi:MAG: hypothetical protein KF773_02960 [Deltaproteobacteria bacterium]|nr:hypothetical protein [Deltaproteobacteria bacterium]
MFAAACGDDNNQTPKDAPPPVDSTVATPDADCFDITNVAAPTHDQIINACTTATKIYKTEKPPLLNPDGSLPPLPQ